MLDPKDIGEWQHEEFYRFIAQAYDKPRYVLHYKTDAPLNIRSIFYVPEQVCVQELCSSSGDESSALYGEEAAEAAELQRISSVASLWWAGCHREMVGVVSCGRS